MPELVMLLRHNKSDIVNALRMKCWLVSRGVKVTGLVIRDESKGFIPYRFVEDIMQLKIVGFMS